MILDQEVIFRTVKQNANPDKYFYSGYGNGFDSRSHFLISNFEFW